jgi:peptidoglycan/LPS O-acetylase OafA/YrhL
VAILLVVACHYYRFPRDGGPVGVGLFFVLSGFLITTLLLEEHAVDGRVGLRRFYARRVRRLLPALAVLLVAYAIVRLLEGGGARGLEVVALSGLYAGNIVQAFAVHDLVSGTSLAHLWSLAQEEQFYVIWPWLLLLVLRARRTMLWIALLLTAMIAYRAGLALHGASVVRLYYGPDTRSDWLIAGAFLAVWRRRGLVVREPVALVGFAILFTGLFLDPWARGWQVWQSPLLTMGCGALVAAGCAPTQMALLLSSRLLVNLGKVSYSLYLWHVPMFAVLGYRRPEIALPLALAASWLSYRYIEQPFRRHRSARVSAVLTPSAVPTA